ncbi:2-phosphosulfolactate phosphatase family protein [Pleurocapsales cyanobacterium LEGE 06147]|nr:2-phosphosulfolactate phosphatase family protein [Pleurocapsales cyanobacterium LEGE 06147]
MKVFVYHTPELTPENSLPDCAVVIDVLRATTTIATALNAGAEAVQAFSNLNQLMEAAEAWLPEKRLRAGERGGAKVEGCDLGNSPLDCTPELVGGKRLFISTTNGTRALQRVEKAATVIAAAMVNRQAAVNYLLTTQPETVWFVGSGWEGSYSLEDTACAGAIAVSLIQQFKSSAATIAGNDEVIAAIALYSQWQDKLLEMFHHSSHGQRLLRLGGDEDLKYCATTDMLEVLPIQKEPGVLIKY